MPKRLTVQQKIWRKTINALRDTLDIALFWRPREKRDLLYVKFLAYRDLRHWPDTQRPQRLLDYLIKALFDDPDLCRRRFITDKELAKVYIKGVCPDARVPRTLAVLRTEAELRTYDFPNPCVIKSTHGSGDALIYRGQSLDYTSLMKYFQPRHYRATREINYRLLAEKILVEEYLDEGTGQGATDYKIWCFFGRAQFVRVLSNRQTGLVTSTYSREWVKLNFMKNEVDHPKPECLGELMRLADRLSEPFHHMRIDCYVVQGQAYVGEITSLHQGGRVRFDGRPEVDLLLAPLMEDPSADLLSLLGMKPPA
ncbi:MAG: ATP-grasp fold amidoligase family protein [Pseudomonadota bacterium]